MSVSIVGQVALITGGGRGVGRATAIAFARAGARVCVVSRTAEQVKNVAAEIEELGGEVMPIVADVGNSADVRRLFDAIVVECGQVDILVNNAGSFPVGPISDFLEAEFDTAVAADLKSVYLCSQAALTIGGMLERGDGQIVSMASASVRRQIPNMAVHCSLKAALLAFSESLRREVASSGIRVSLICPGTIDTELVRSAAARAYVHAADKWLQPGDVADLVLYAATRRRGVNISETTILGI